MGAKRFGTMAPTWRLSIILTVLICLASCAVAANRAITQVDVTNKADCVIITVQADGALSMGVIKSTAGRFLGFQFPCRMTAKGGLAGIHSGRVFNVRYSNFSPNPPTTRIVVNTVCQTDFSTQWSADRSRVDITILKFGRAQAAKPVAQARPLSMVNGDFIPVAVKSEAQKSSIPVKAEPQKPAAVLPAPRQTLPTSVAARPCLPVISTSKPAVSAASAPVPAEPIPGTGLPPLTSAAALRPAAPVLHVTPSVSMASAPAAPVATSVPAKVVSNRTVPVQVAVAGSVEQISEGAGPSGEPEARPNPVVRITRAPALLAKSNVLERSSDKPERKVSLNFLGADIHDVLKALSTQSGQNIVAGKDVTGNVTVSLANVGVEDALDYVAKLSGYSYLKDRGTYLVGPASALSSLTDKDSGTPKTEVVALNYASSTDVMALLKAQYPSLQVTKGSGAASSGSTSGAAGAATTPGTSVLVLNGSERTVDEAKTLVAQVEKSMKGDTAEETSEVYEVKYVAPNEMVMAIRDLVPEVKVTLAPSDGFTLAAPDSVGVDATGSKVAQVKNEKKQDDIGWTQRLVFTGPGVFVKKALDLALKFDIRSPQIRIDAKITSLNTDVEKKLGIKWSWGDFGLKEGFTDFAATFGPAEGTNTQNIRIPHYRFAHTPVTITAVMEAMIQNGDGKLLAAPSLVCIEGKPGVFFVGDQVRYIILKEQTQTGMNVRTEDANVGIQLRVVGDVSPDGYVTLNLHPEVSVLQLTADKDSGIMLPLITRRFTDHVVRVKDGQTIVIGGLIRDEDLDTLTKVPLLGDLPFFGQLFRHRVQTKNHSEVVMLITASTIKD